MNNKIEGWRLDARSHVVSDATLFGENRMGAFALSIRPSVGVVD